MKNPFFYLMCVTIVIVVLAISKCSYDTVKFNNEYKKETSNWLAPTVWQDPDTKCQYYLDNSGNIRTPRLGTDGGPLCGEQLPIGGE